MTAPEHRASINLAAFPRGPKSETRVSFDTYRGRSFANLRTWYRGTDGEWHPTRQGVVFEVADLPTLARAVADAIERTKGGA